MYTVSCSSWKDYSSPRLPDALACMYGTSKSVVLYIAKFMVSLLERSPFVQYESKKVHEVKSSKP